jgi:ribosome recycling factor
VRVPIPELSQERRTELSKIAHKYAEQAKVSVRNVRRDGMEMLKKLEKDGQLSQDAQRTWSDKVQKLTDEHIAAIDKALAAKEKEIMQI